MTPVPSTLKKCLVCGIEYFNSARAEKVGSCPACGTQGVENKTFEFVFQQKPYDETNFIPMHVDNGCGVARAVNNGEAHCVECPFEEKCLGELHHAWNYYAVNKKKVAAIFSLSDQGGIPHKIANEVRTCSSSVYGCLKDRHIIEPIYKKLKGMDLTKIEGPKS